MVEHLFEGGVEAQVVVSQVLSIVRDHGSDHKGLRFLLKEVILELLEIRQQTIHDLSGIALTTHVVGADLDDEDAGFPVVGLREVEDGLLEVNIHLQAGLGLAENEAFVPDERLLVLELRMIELGDEMVPHQMRIADPNVANASLKHVLGTRHLKRND